MIRLYRFLHMYYISYIDPTKTSRNDSTTLHGLLVAKVLLVIMVSAALIYCAEYNREYTLYVIRLPTPHRLTAPLTCQPTNSPTHLITFSGVR